MTGILDSFKRLVDTVRAQRGTTFRKKKAGPTQVPYGHRRRKARRVNKAAKAARKLNRTTKKNRKLPPRS